MHTNSLIVSLDHLNTDEEMPISFVLEPSFLELSPQDEMKPSRPVVIEGTVSLVDDYVLLNMEIRAFFHVHCASCNDVFEYEVCLDQFSHQELLENIARRKWDVSEIVREAIVIELPLFPQCGGKECLHMDEIQKYFHTLSEEKEEEKSSPFQSFFDTLKK
jgi:uncharacterized metal-binding protein YceD (DUF177 family)